MFEAVESPYVVPFDGSFRVKKAPTGPTEKRKKKELQEELADHVDRLDELQRILYAHDKHSILLVFQAMDAAGKDGTIRAVLSGVNPAGCHVSSFKAPSKEELDHEFLWRSAKVLPERGTIGVFNRSYYEEVLVVRVHPEFLGGQNLPDRPKTLTKLWKQRYESIRDHEKHLARNGTVILKFWLNVSRDEQRKRFLARIEEPEKNWKFSTRDVEEAKHWPQYMEAYEDLLNATSRAWAPWYAIPADDKRAMRVTVADIVQRTMEGLGLTYPQVDEETRARFDAMRKILADGGGT